MRTSLSSAYFEGFSEGLILRPSPEALQASCAATANAQLAFVSLHSMTDPRACDLQQPPLLPAERHPWGLSPSVQILYCVGFHGGWGHGTALAKELWM